MRPTTPSLHPRLYPPILTKSVVLHVFYTKKTQVVRWHRTQVYLRENGHLGPKLCEGGGTKSFFIIFIGVFHACECFIEVFGSVRTIFLWKQTIFEQIHEIACILAKFTL